MSDEADHLAAALYFAERAKRTREEGERARLLAVAAKYREMAIVEAVAFVMETPKRPAAASVRQRAIAKKRANDKAGA
jgi:hypothetical protein